MTLWAAKEVLFSLFSPRTAPKTTLEAVLIPLFGQFLPGGWVNGGSLKLRMASRVGVVNCSGCRRRVPHYGWHDDVPEIPSRHFVAHLLQGEQPGAWNLFR